MSNFEHHYHYQTRLYTHTAERVPNPKKKGAFLPVLHATPDPLPALQQYEAARRADDDSGWEVVPDYRGIVWDTSTKEPDTHEDVGLLPDGLTHLQPGQYDQWDGKVWVKDTAAELADLRDVAADKVRAAFAEAIQQPVSAHGATWNGGMDSALALDGAVRLAEQVGAAEVDLYDFENNRHSVEITIGRSIAIAVAADYQKKMQRKQQLLQSIKTNNVDQLNSLTWAQ